MGIYADASLPVEISSRGGVGVAVYVQDQITPPLDLPFLRELGTATLASNATVGTRTVTLAAGHGFVAGNVIEFADTANGSLFMQARVLSVASDTLTLDSLINRTYTVGNTYVVRSSRSMNVDGSTTPVVFKVEPLPDQSGDIVQLIIAITDNAAMDFETFGGIPALTRGVMLRVNYGDGTFKNIANFKTNGDIERFSFDSKYFINNGGGIRGFTGRMTFGGQDKHGVVIRLDGALNEALEVVVQDNLTGIISMSWLAQGSEIQG